MCVIFDKCQKQFVFISVEESDIKAIFFLQDREHASFPLNCDFSVRFSIREAIGMKKLEIYL